MSATTCVEHGVDLNDLFGHFVQWRSARTTRNLNEIAEGAVRFALCLNVHFSVAGRDFSATMSPPA
jgi:hypothetical protein